MEKYTERLLEAMGKVIKKLKVNKKILIIIKSKAIINFGEKQEVK